MPVPIAISDLKGLSFQGAWDRVPAGVRVAALTSGAGATDPSDARWSYLMQVSDSKVFRDGEAGAGIGVLDLVAARSDHAVGVLSGQPPFVGGWIGFLGYEAGRGTEPRGFAGAGPAPRSSKTSAWPVAVWQRCRDGLAHDAATGRWFQLGAGLRLAQAPPDLAFRAGALRSATGREEYLRQARRVIDYIRAGDIYQANLSHRLRGSFAGSARGAWRALTRTAQPWFGAYLEFEHDGARFALASASPEMFLTFDPVSRRLATRPMKGTRALRAGAERDLAVSAKDQAELNMIVDLMRNDLGRVCEIGSVRVEGERRIEAHGGSLLQSTALVSGVLREGRGLGDAIRAAFPGGSITGAPKIRAMQIIEELEPEARGAYCGCVGYVGEDGHAAFNIAIRSAMIRGRAGGGGLDAIEDGVLEYSVGAGVVADSVPEQEWRETLDKASILRAVARIEEEA